MLFFIIFLVCAMAVLWFVPVFRKSRNRNLIALKSSGAGCLSLLLLLFAVLALPFRNFRAETPAEYTIPELDRLFAECSGSPAEYAIRTAKNGLNDCVNLLRRHRPNIENPSSSAPVKAIAEQYVPSRQPGRR